MPLLHKRQLVTDNWQWVATGTLPACPSLPAGDLLLPLTTYLEHALAWLARPDNRVGVLVNGDDDWSVLADHLNQLALIAVDFPVFRDGRGFSIAQTLVRLGFEGELRAQGQILPDQLAFMERCGFTSFLLEAPLSSTEEASLDEISVHYQAAVREIYS